MEKSKIEAFIRKQKVASLIRTTAFCGLLLKAEDTIAI